MAAASFFRRRSTQQQREWSSKREKTSKSKGFNYNTYGAGGKFRCFADFPCLCGESASKRLQWQIIVLESLLNFNHTLNFKDLYYGLLINHGKLYVAVIYKNKYFFWKNTHFYRYIRKIQFISYYYEFFVQSSIISGNKKLLLR